MKMVRSSHTAYLSETCDVFLIKYYKWSRFVTIAMPVAFLTESGYQIINIENKSCKTLFKDIQGTPVRGVSKN